MVFRRRGRSLGNVVHSYKHIVDSQGALSGALESVTPIATTVVSGTAITTPDQVPEGSTINGMFITVFFIGATGAPLTAPLGWYVYKVRSGQDDTNFADPVSFGVSDTRNQVFHMEKGLAGSGDGTAMAFKGVIVIPKNMRRMRQGDSIRIKMKSADATVDATFCFRAIYKHFQ